MMRNWFLVCLVAVSFSSPGFAQSSGKEAFDAWLKTYGALGMQASYASADESGDRLTIQDFKLTYSLAIGGEGGTDQDAEQIDFSWTTPELTATAFAAGADGYSVDRMTLSDDTGFKVHFDSEDGSDISMSATVEGYLLTDAFWPRYPEIAVDPDRPVSRWLPVLQTIADYEVGENRIARMAISVSESGGAAASETISYEMRDMLIKDMRDGVIGQYSSGPFSQITPVRDQDGHPVDVKITMAGTSAKHYDIKALFSLFDPISAENKDFTRVIGSAEVRDYRIVAGPVNVLIDRITYEDFAVRPPDSQILPLLDAAVAGQQVDEAKLGIAFFDIYRAMALGRMSIDGVSASFPDPENPSRTGSAEMGKMLVSDLSAEGLGEFSISSVKASAGNSGTFRLGKFSIGNIDFAPYGPMKALIDRLIAGAGDPDPFEIARAFTPRSMSMGVDDLYIRIPGEVEGGLDRYALNWSTTVPPIPTSIELSIEGLELPVSAIEDRQARAMLMAAGIEKLRITEDLKLQWDEQSKDLIVENLTVEVAPVGVVRAKARLGGLPKSVLQNPEQMESALATLTLKSLEFDLLNDGGVETALDLASKQSGATKEQMMQFLRFQLTNALAVVGDQKFTSMVMDEADTFFADPRSLSVRLAPENPVSVLQIIASAGIAPRALPGLLAVSVEANTCSEVASDTSSTLEDRSC